ncbi:MerR family transcriptional regulator [Comamonas serinivorans]|uniref:MerR family transcriptional regulator n=1 Tax=Comamonas serinivorans TaxID=1082851 RepID=A0A1Y0ES66_9BURK|nr:MerR family transcriptional regulator [Comamonas serinivorans]
MSTTYRIGDLAREFDLTPRAMRFYEDMGLLTPERTGASGQQRVYSARDRVRLKLTLRAKRLGLSLTEAKALIDMYDSPRDTRPQLERFLQVLGEHRLQLEARMTELQATLAEVRAHEREARALLRQASAQGEVQAHAPSATADTPKPTTRRTPRPVAKAAKPAAKRANLSAAPARAQRRSPSGG